MWRIPMKTKLTITFLAAALVLRLDGQRQTFRSHVVRIPGGFDVLVTGENDSGEMVANYTDTAGTTQGVTIVGSTKRRLSIPTKWARGRAKEHPAGASITPARSRLVFSRFLRKWICLYRRDLRRYHRPGRNRRNHGLRSQQRRQTSSDLTPTTSGSTVSCCDVLPIATKLWTYPRYATLAIGINDHGEITFERVNASFVFSGSVWKNGTYTIINVPGASQSKARGINIHGQIVLNAQDGSGVWHASFIRPVRSRNVTWPTPPTRSVSASTPPRRSSAASTRQVIQPGNSASKAAFKPVSDSSLGHAARGGPDPPRPLLLSWSHPHQKFPGYGCTCTTPDYSRRIADAIRPPPVVRSTGQYLRRLPGHFCGLSLVTFQLHGTATQVSMILVAYMIPLAIVSPLAGVYVDKWNVKWTSRPT